MIGTGLPGEPERKSELLRNGSIDGNDHGQIHRIAKGKAADYRGSERRPGPGFAGLALLQEVLLINIELRRHVIGIRLPRRSLEGT
ncbi:hypothetical protein D3C73_1546620 [compost metagenome]